MRRSFLPRLILWLALLAVLLFILVRGTQGGLSMPLFKSVDTEIILDQRYDLHGTQTVAVDTAALRVVVHTTPDSQARVVFESNLPEKNRTRLTVSQENGALVIREEPHLRIGFFLNVFEQITLYLPTSYHEKLDLRLLSGSLSIPDDLSVRTFAARQASGSTTLASLRCETYALASSSGSIRAGAIFGDGEISQTSGSVQVDTLYGNQHTVSSASGSLRLGAVRGELNAHNTSGLMQIEQLTGAGSFEAVSGSLRVGVAELLGDLTVQSTSGSVRVVLPRAASFRFHSRSNSGSTRTDFPTQKEGKEVTATVGDHPEYTVSCRTTSGSVRFTYE